MADDVFDDLEFEPERRAAARSTSIVAAVISGPMPSPGNTKSAWTIRS